MNTTIREVATAMAPIRSSIGIIDIALAMLATIHASAQVGFTMYASKPIVAIAIFVIGSICVGFGPAVALAMWSAAYARANVDFTMAATVTLIAFTVGNAN
jgi:hypothetical protein